MSVVAVIVSKGGGANRNDESWCGDVLSRMGISAQPRNDGVESVKTRGRYRFYGGDGKINKKMVIVQTSMTNCGGVMLYHG